MAKFVKRRTTANMTPVDQRLRPDLRALKGEPSNNLVRISKALGLLVSHCYWVAVLGKFANTMHVNPTAVIRGELASRTQHCLLLGCRTPGGPGPASER